MAERLRKRPLPLVLVALVATSDDVDHTGAGKSRHAAHNGYAE